MATDEELEAAQDWRQIFERLSSDPYRALVERDLAITHAASGKHDTPQLKNTHGQEV
jgi:hypothetical protein